MRLGETDQVYNKTFATIICAISTCARLHLAYNMPQKLRLESAVGQLMFKTETHSDGPTIEFTVELPLGLVFPPHMLTVLLREFALPGL